MLFNKRNIGLLITLVLIAIQFYRPDKNLQLDLTADDFLIHENAPENVARLIKNTCYDCHTDYTNYSWFNNIAPLSWWVDNHAEKGKKNLNLSNWALKDIRDKRSMLAAMAFDVTEEKMPLKTYLLFHPDKKLSEEDKKVIMDWFYTIDIN